MRLLGIDTAYRNDAADPELVAQGNAEGRVVLTKDRGLLQRRELSAGAYVRGDSPDDQLADVLDRFAPPVAPWTRCLACNGGLDPVAKQEVEHLLEPGPARRTTVSPGAASAASSTGTVPMPAGCRPRRPGRPRQ